MMHDPVSAAANGFAALLAAALLLSIVAERIRIPPAVLLVTFGVLIGSVWHVSAPFAFGPALLFVFLPPLIFEAAWHVDLRLLRRVAASVLWLAFPGTLITACAVALVLPALGALPFAAAFLYGAAISATDPVAVVAVFRATRVPATLRTIVEAESIANDGVAVVLFASALTIAQGGAVDLWIAMAHGLVAIAGGVLVGLGCAYLVALLLRTTAASAYEVTATVALAYGAYLIADHFALSGIFATATGAMVLRFLQHRSDALFVNVDDADRFWNTGAYIANAVVFVATGLTIDASRLLHEPYLVATAIGIVLVTRALLVLLVTREPRARATVFLAGMRAALPLALALSIPVSIANRPAIIDAVFATVVVTLILQGLPLEAIVRRFYGDTHDHNRIGGPESSS